MTGDAPVAGRSRTHPLSVGQERLWLLDRLDPDDTAFTMYLVRRLRGPLVRPALQDALDALVTRHEPLRTRFPAVDGQPVAVVDPPAPVRLEVVDADGAPVADGPGSAVADGPSSAAAPDDGTAAARRVVHARLAVPFDLAGGPLFRATLVRVGPEDHVLCLVVHHLVADGWSLDLVMRELTAAYDASLDGRPADLAPLPITFGDHVVRERAEPESPEHCRYWTERLAGAPVLELPTDRPRPAVRAPAGDLLAIRVPDGLAADVARLARTLRATPYMVLLAAFQALLGRYARQDDVCVGSPAAGRTRPELEPLVGYFLTTMVLRGDLRGDPTFGALVGRTRTAALEAFTHADVPFERLIEDLDLDRDLGRTPLFDVMFVLQQGGGPDLAPRGLRVEAFDAGTHQAKVDLTCEVWTGPDGMLVNWEYRTDLFDRATIARLADHFTALLAAAVADPETRLSGLPPVAADLLPPGQRRRLDADGTGPPAPTGPERTVVELFRAVVAADPGRVALRTDLSTVSYAELAERVDALAAVLAARGAGPERLVAVCVERSPDLVVALLGILASGAAYVPLDPGHPPARSASLLRSAAPDLLVTTRDLLGGLPARAGAGPDGARLLVATVDGAAGPPTGDAHGDPVDVDGAPDPSAGAARAAAERPATAADPGDTLAYLVHTSGSTGEPKGVAIPHRALLARVRWMVARYGLTPADRVLQFAAVTFDTAAEEIFPTLAAGATLVLPSLPSAQLPDVLTSDLGGGLTVLDLPTSYWHQLVAEPGAVRWPAGLRLVILGGDQADAAAVGRWRAQSGDRVALVNTYGPTETTIVATVADLGAADARSRPPIGRPVAGVRVRVVDGAGELVPVGVVGELLIGGVGVARGYRGRPGTTAARFVPDPDVPGARMYRSGDLARWRADGVLEFVGRADDQVKVRGHRIEVGEVEVALAALPGVAGAVVAARADGTGDRRLLAWVVPAPGATPDPVALRADLARTLPGYLVPAAIGLLDRVPLTAHGKVDRRALPDPAPPDRAAEYVPPRTTAEELVADVWADVLGLDRVGATADFFDVGGHSLVATRVAARLSAALDLEVPIRTLFTHRTVARVAGYVETLLAAEIAALSDADVEQQLAGTE